MNKVINYLRELNPTIFVAIGLAILLVYGFITAIAAETLGVVELDPAGIQQNIRDEGLIIFYFMLAIVAPLVETAISQKLLYFLLRKIKWLEANPLYIAIIAGLFFGLSHTYSLAYVILACGAGFLFMCFYIIRFGRGSYWLTAIIHSLYNIIVTTIDIAQPE